MGVFTSVAARDGSGCTTANFENLSMQVRNSFLSVAKLSMCNISPAYEGIGVAPNSCFCGCLSYLDFMQTLQFATTSLARLDILGK